MLFFLAAAFSRRQAMQELTTAGPAEAPITFLIWIGIWILALAVLLPALG
jgi:hypothetical protein